MWLMVKLTGSGAAVGLTAAMQFLPILLFGAWGGVLADRFAKRRLLTFTQAAMIVPPARCSCSRWRARWRPGWCWRSCWCRA